MSKWIHFVFYSMSLHIEKCRSVNKTLPCWHVIIIWTGRYVYTFLTTQYTCQLLNVIHTQISRILLLYQFGQRSNVIVTFWYDHCCNSFLSIEHWLKGKWFTCDVPVYWYIHGVTLFRVIYSCHMVNILFESFYCICYTLINETLRCCKIPVHWM